MIKIFKNFKLRLIGIKQGFIKFVINLGISKNF